MPSNWASLKKKLDSKKSSSDLDGSKRARSEEMKAKAKAAERAMEQFERGGAVEEQKINIEGEKAVSQELRQNYVGLDCEMVGLGPTGKQSALARCCLVDFDGEVVYDQFVRPKGFVTDFRTKYSGVRSSDIRRGEAVTFEECQAAVAVLLKGKTLVGHALRNDLDVMMLGHPRIQIRDTAKYKPLMREIKHANNSKFKPKALRHLARSELGLTIQAGEHDPSVDARTAMALYRKHRDQWERGLKESGLKRFQADKDKESQAGAEGIDDAHPSSSNAATSSNKRSKANHEKKGANTAKNNLKTNVAPSSTSMFFEEAGKGLQSVLEADSRLKATKKKDKRKREL